MRRFPVQLRFQPYTPCSDKYGAQPLPPQPPIAGPPGCVPVPIGTLASGFEQRIAGAAAGVQSPVLAAHDPAVGQFIKTNTPAAVLTLRNAYSYIPPNTPDGRIGVLAIGESPMSWRRSYHGEIFIGVPPGAGEFELAPTITGQQILTNFEDGTESFTADFTGDFA